MTREEFAAATAGLKGIYDSIKGIYTLKTEADRASAIHDIAMKASDASMALLEARSAMETLSAENAQLAKVNAELCNFMGDKENYTLKRFNTNGFAYVDNRLSDDGSQPPYFCAHCFGNLKASILQPTGESVGRDRLFKCATCAAKPLLGHIVS